MWKCFFNTVEISNLCRTRTESNPIELIAEYNIKNRINFKDLFALKRLFKKKTLVGQTIILPIKILVLPTNVFFYTFG